MKPTSWKDFAELLGLTAIIVSLAVLIIEVRENTIAIERQMALDRADSFTSPFFESKLPSILAKIKSIDGPDSNIVPLMEAYDLSYTDAVIWERHLQYIWEVLEAEFEADGPSTKLDESLLSLLLSRDNQLYVTHSGKYRFSSEFRDYLAKLQDRLSKFESEISE